jgi:SAM-dependent methyltransferase
VLTRKRDAEPSPTRAAEPHKLAEIRTAEESRRAGEPGTFRKPFGRPWASDYWLKWATITEAFYRLGIPEGATVLDVGCGTGWTTLFLAEAGFEPLGVELAPASVEIAVERAARWGNSAGFVVGDMDELELGRPFDAALVFDALHHTTRPARAILNIAEHLRPGGWLLVGEPSWLHGLSPHARRTSKTLGWVERGVTARQLKRHCQAAGLGSFKRFHEGTQPYAGRAGEFAWQAIRLFAANFAVAPQASVWFAARKT